MFYFLRTSWSFFGANTDGFALQRQSPGGAGGQRNKAMACRSEGEKEQQP